MTKEDFIKLYNISQEAIDTRINQHIEECTNIYKERMNLNGEELENFIDTAKRINVLERIDFFLDEKGEIFVALNCPDWPSQWYFEGVMKLK